MQLPLIHLNGSSPERLLGQYRDALDAVNAAVEALQRVDVNARDYYPISPDAASAAIREHRERLEKLRGVSRDLLAVCEDIQRQVDERGAR